MHTALNNSNSNRSNSNRNRSSASPPLTSRALHLRNLEAKVQRQRERDQEREEEQERERRAERQVGKEHPEEAQVGPRAKGEQLVALEPHAEREQRHVAADEQQRDDQRDRDATCELLRIYYDLGLEPQQ